MKYMQGVTFFVCILLSSLTQAGEPWLNIVKSENGFLFKGHLDGAPYSFDIPGSDIKVAGDNNRPMVLIDNVFFQIVRVKNSDFSPKGAEVLDAHKAYEQKHLKDNFEGIKLKDVDVCKGSGLKHQYWTMEAPFSKTPNQVFVTIEVGNYVLMIGSAYKDEEQRKTMAGKFESLCKSFKHKTEYAQQFTPVDRPVATSRRLPDG
jgi:hypothetical protein